MMAVKPLSFYGALGAANGAAELRPGLWVSSAKSDRIEIFDLEP